ncbi:OprO/OprP family phosphate-selective porin [Methylomonas sp. 11b]|uniref:OprO/OprP family phosphate-selective porin n=1 Tax=Methylomonas sp. 11b TaxID=1168169 RepID=UPI000569C0CE|nr:porin [Methylomonas sp. 11b]
MRLSKLSLAVAAVMGSGICAEAMALDLYVDAKTKQIFAEPGPGRTKLGSFEKVEDTAAQKAEAQAQKAEIAQIKEDLALKNNELKALDEHIKDPKFSELELNEKGIKFESKDGNFEMAINGRMQVDAQMNVSDGSPISNSTATPNDTQQLADGANIRRARLGVEGSYYHDWEYKFEYDFSRGGNSGVAAGITDAYINWRGYDPLGVKVGSFKEPFSLEEATSNRWLTFIERNMAVNAFSDNPNAYKTGFALTWSDPRWTAAGAIMTEPVGGGWAYTSSRGSNGNNNRNGGSGDMGWELTGRVTALPWFEDKTKFLHVGASGSQRYLNDAGNNNAMRYQAAITNVDRTAIIDTGTGIFDNVSTITRMGGESALVYGPFSAQAEYIQADLSGRVNNNESLNGYYGYVSYFLTGESRAYKTKTGAWDRLKPKRHFDMKGGLGAWEVAAGYDYLDLNDKNVRGGRAAVAKFGLNWYPNSHIKMMANYIHALEIQRPGTSSLTAPTNGAGYDGSKLDAFELRGQVDF